MGRFFWEKFLEFGLERRSRLLTWTMGLLLIFGLVKAQTPGESGNAISVPSASNAVRCGAGSVSFTTTGCAVGYTAKWYDDSKLSNQVNSGVFFRSPYITSTTNYYLVCEADTDAMIKSPVVEVTAIIKPLTPVNISGPTFVCANNDTAYYSALPEGGYYQVLPDNALKGGFTVRGGTLALHPGRTFRDYDSNFQLNYYYTDPATGCQNYAYKSIRILPAPKPVVNSPTICSGQTAMLSIKKCNGGILWSTGETSQNVWVTPSATTEYKIKCTVEQCDTTITAKVTVVQKPPALISGPDEICAKNLPIFYDATPVGGVFVLPEDLPDGMISIDGNRLTVNKASDITNFTFKYRVTDSAYQCSAEPFATKHVFIAPTPKPIITKPTTICAGSVTRLRIDQCLGKILWNTGADGVEIDVSPALTTDYSVRCTVNKCDTILTTRVTVNGTKPSITSHTLLCNEEKSAYTVDYIMATSGAILSTNRGLLEKKENWYKVVGIPSGQSIEIYANLNGCVDTLKARAICKYASCDDWSANGEMTISSVTATMASCSGSVPNNDASFTINLPNHADRYTYAESPAGLLSYENAASTIIDYYRRPYLTVSNLPNPVSVAGKTYYVRIYTSPNYCFLDTIVTIPYRDCSIPCTKPDAGGNLFLDFAQSFVKLKTATPQQRWVAYPENGSATIHPTTGWVTGLADGARSTFVLVDRGPGSNCADTAYIYTGVDPLPDIMTYSDTLTLPSYSFRVQSDTNKIVWTAADGNPATLTIDGKISGMNRPGSYVFYMKALSPFSNKTGKQTVIKLAKPDDCPPQLCLPFSIKKLKLAAK